MNVDTCLLRVVLLVIPGFAGYRTFRTIQSTGKSRKQIKDWQDLLAIVFVSAVAYGLLYVIYRLILIAAHWSGNQTLSLTVTSIDALVNQQVSLNFFEIIYASLVAILVGIFAGFLYNKKTLFKVARAVGISNHYGDDDVWSYLMNSDDIEWIFVRDNRVDVVYYGRLTVFSESDEKRELLLENVDVYSNTDGRKMYHSDSLYISRKDNELTIEVSRPISYFRGGRGKVYVGSEHRRVAYTRRKGKKRRS